MAESDPGPIAARRRSHRMPLLLWEGPLNQKHRTRRLVLYFWRVGPIRGSRGETPLPQDAALVVGGPSRPDLFFCISLTFEMHSRSATCLGSEHVSPTSLISIAERSLV